MNVAAAGELAKASPVVSIIEPLLPLPFPLEPRGDARPSLCVVIPVYNEERVLTRTYEELTAVLNRLEVDW